MKCPECGAVRGHQLGCSLDRYRNSVEPGQLVCPKCLGRAIEGDRPERCAECGFEAEPLSFELAGALRNVVGPEHWVWGSLTGVRDA